MPITVHKILIHGCDIIQFSDLPIGVLSEEALEARHKDNRHNRLCHTRKTSQEDNNKYLRNILLRTSDPLILGKRKSKPKDINRGIVRDIENYLEFAVHDGKTIEL